MRIAIIGAGNVGQALARGWSRAGHQIAFGIKDPSDPKYRPAAEESAAELSSIGRAVEGADVIVLAVPWQAAEDAIAACGDLWGKLVIDVTNPLKMGPHGLELAVGFDTSGGEIVARLAKGAAVFKAMNQIGYGVMDRTSGYPARPVMFVAGDDATRRPIIMRLVADLGFDAQDAGPLRISRLLEPFAMLWIHQVINCGAPTDSAFAFMRRSESR